MRSSPMLVLPKPFLPGRLPCELKTGLGYACTLRALQPRDVGRLTDFFRSHSTETLRNRYGYHRADLTPERAARLVAADTERGAALALVEGRGGSSRIVAIGRFTVGDDPRAAEVAFVVHEERRRYGMATVLLEALSVLAGARGVERFTAQTQADNFGMLSIFIKHGGRVRRIEGTDGIEVELPVAGSGASGSA